MGYRKLDERDIAYLKKVTEDGRVLTGSDISQDYSHDELGEWSALPKPCKGIVHRRGFGHHGLCQSGGNSRGYQRLRHSWWGRLSLSTEALCWRPHR